MSSEKCPKCNLELFENKWRDLVCPNCGIIKYHEEKSEEKPSYIN